MLVVIQNKKTYYKPYNDKSADAVKKVVNLYTFSEDLLEIVVSKLLIAGYSVRLKD